MGGLLELYLQEFLFIKLALSALVKSHEFILVNRLSICLQGMYSQLHGVQDDFFLL